MKRKILIVILGLIVLSQIPFAYRRYRLGRLRNTIQQLAAQRVPPSAENEYVDYKGVIHVHSFLGGHSTGTFAELIAAAKANQLDFVIMTEHPQAEFDTSAMTLNGTHAGVLFINGNEVASADGDRLLLIPGRMDPAFLNARKTQDIIKEQKEAEGGLAFITYPAESRNWQSTAASGVEVYNLFTNARQINPVVMLFDGLWSYRSYPDLMFANFFTRPNENLKLWDEAITNHRTFVAIAGNDAHSNVGLSLNDASGQQWLGVKLDPYERSFRVVRTHVLIKKTETLTRETLLAALSQGHCYVSFDIFADPSGFSFDAENLVTVEYPRATMGEWLPSFGQTRLVAKAPLNCRFVLYRDGIEIDQKAGTAVEFLATRAGRYRVEAYLDMLPAPANGKPWIISNPIYLEPILTRAPPKSAQNSSKQAS